jgi:hypothetical protein
MSLSNGIPPSNNRIPQKRRFRTEDYNHQRLPHEPSWCPPFPSLFPFSFCFSPTPLLHYPAPLIPPSLPLPCSLSLSWAEIIFATKVFHPNVLYKVQWPPLRVCWLLEYHDPVFPSLHSERRDMLGRAENRMVPCVGFTGPLFSLLTSLFDGCVKPRPRNYPKTVCVPRCHRFIGGPCGRFALKL